MIDVLDLSTHRVRLVTEPVDLRLGFDSLTFLLAGSYNLDIGFGTDYVVFVGKTYKKLRLIGLNGNQMVVLNSGLIRGTRKCLISFLEEAPPLCDLTAEELDSYMKGQIVKPKSLSKESRA